MTRNLARYEQFLRILAVLDILAAARGPLDDQALIAAVKERLGLSRLSPRTLHRDCEFLVTCGYPIDHAPLPTGRKYGWQFDAAALAGRRIPPEPLTLLELTAFSVGRDLLKAFEGTVLWTGIESLWAKLQRGLSPSLAAQVDAARRVFHVPLPDLARYAARPRLLSAISRAITDCREIHVEEQKPGIRRRLQPMMLIVNLPKIQLAAWEKNPGKADPPVVIDLDTITKVTPLDATFSPRPIDPTTFGAG